MEHCYKQVVALIPTSATPGVALTELPLPSKIRSSKDLPMKIGPFDVGRSSYSAHSGGRRNSRGR